MKAKHSLNMTQGDPMNLMIRFAVPLFFGNLLQQFYNLADTSIAGNILGENALSQIGATAAFYSLITNLAFSLNNGFALFVSRAFGMGKKKEMERAVCWTVTLSMIFAFGMTGIFLGFREQILGILQVKEEIWDGALGYLTIVLAGIPLIMGYNLEAGLMQALGNGKVPLFFLAFSSILNVILDLLFMGPLGLGVRGAAAATVLAQGISAVLGVWYIATYVKELHFTRDSFRVHGRFVVEMLETGISMALMSTIYNIGSVVLQSSINALGSVYIAAQVGGRRLAELFFTPGSALGTGMATFASQNYGAGKRSRILKGAHAAVILYGIWWVLVMVLTFTVVPEVIRLMTGSENPEIINNAVMYLRISVPMIPPMAVLVILRNMLQGMRHSLAPLFCSSLELIGKLIFAIWLVPALGYRMVCICEPVTWVVCFVFIVAAVWIFRRDFTDRKIDPA